MHSTDDPATAAPRAVRAALDPALRAEIVARVPLRYTAGADPALDRPAHVRAGSGLAWVGARLAVVQDDAGFVALVDPARDVVDAVTLPAGPGGVRQFDEGRGNKRHKLDLESCVVHDGVLYAFGSGSTPARERVLRVAGLDAAPAHPPAPDVALLAAPALYAALRGAHAFAGSELNVEGAAVVASASGPALRLFQRGNGAARDGLEPIDATCDLALAALLAHLADPARAPVPAPARITRYDLGAIAGARLTFTDATPSPARRGAVFYLAAAEDSPDTYRDGPVTGCALGVIDDPGDAASVAPRVRYAHITDAATGAPACDKPEGLALDPADPSRAYLVIDRDDPSQPSELCTLVLRGPW